MNTENLVALAVENYTNLPPAPFDNTITPETFYLATPNRLAYALGWIAASAIVSARYIDSAIDAIPIFHPDHGWDRFLISRRVSCKVHENEPADRFGVLMLSGDDAPRLTSPGGTERIALGQSLVEDPDKAINDLLAFFPRQGIDPGSHSQCWHTKASRYPEFYHVVTEMIIENPGLVASREVYIDDEEVDGQYHPLHLHATDLTGMGPEDRTGQNIATMTFAWFQLQYGELFGYFDIAGGRTVYRTDHNTWSRVRKQLNQEPEDQVKQRIESWMRISGAPNLEID